ncbi:MAG: protein of unknown function DUF3168 [Siphoviridae sp. ctCJE6]|nr:MAG: protein of unknown function DUF3168 [Siphoviridae sp. ctCJE6]
MSSPAIEERVIQKVRDLLIADDVIENYTGKRVYASHISSIEEPKYPAISIFLLFSNAVFAVPGMTRITLQIDTWFLSTEHDLADVLTVHGKIKDALHRQNLIDSTIGIKVAQCIEVNAGPLLFESDTQLFHYPAEYSIVASL